MGAGGPRRDYADSIENDPVIYGYCRAEAWGFCTCWKGEEFRLRLRERQCWIIFVIRPSLRASRHRITTDGQICFSQLDVAGSGFAA